MDKIIQKSFSDLLSGEIPNGAVYLPENSKDWKAFTNVILFPEEEYTNADYISKFIDWINKEYPSYTFVCKSSFLSLTRGYYDSGNNFVPFRRFINSMSQDYFISDDIPESIMLRFPSKHLYEENNNSVIKKLFRFIFKYSNKNSKSEDKPKTPKRKQINVEMQKVMKDRLLTIDAEELTEHGINDLIDNINKIIRESNLRIEPILNIEYADDNLGQEMEVKLPNGNIIKLYDEETTIAQARSRATLATLEYLEYFLNSTQYKILFHGSQEAYILKYNERISLGRKRSVN